LQQGNAGGLGFDADERIFVKASQIHDKRFNVIARELFLRTKEDVRAELNITVYNCTHRCILSMVAITELMQK